MNTYQHPIMMAQGRLPAGRRARGFGMSPFGPGGPSAIHQMNYMRMGPGGLSSLLGAGCYPFPQRPVPAALMGFGGGMPPYGGGGRPGRMPMSSMSTYAGCPLYPMGMSTYGSSMSNPMAYLSFMYGNDGGMSPYMDTLYDDDNDWDDGGMWDLAYDEGDTYTKHMKNMHMRKMMMMMQGPWNGGGMGYL